MDSYIRPTLTFQGQIYNDKYMKFAKLELETFMCRFMFQIKMQEKLNLMFKQINYMQRRIRNISHRDDARLFLLKNCWNKTYMKV